MRHARLAISPDEGALHPVVDLLVGSEFVAEARLLYWNLVDETEPVLHFLVDGDRERFATSLDGLDTVAAADLTAVDEDHFYLHLRPELTATVRSILEVVADRAIVVALPIVYRDGRATLDVVGEAADLQTTVDALPDGVRVDVERVGAYTGGPESAVAALSDRQREALLAALDLGYYDPPSAVTHEDIAAVLDCAPSTASEHLRRGEAKLVRAVLGPTPPVELASVLGR